MARVTALNINGKKTEVDVDSAVSLLSVLRDSLDLTGTKYGCGEGQCGACTVLLDGQPTRSCVTQVGRAAGKQITKIEGLEKDGKRTLLPIHQLCLFKLGVPLCEMWYLHELATWLREHNRSRFLLTAPPLRLPGIVGSPLTPIATV